MIGQRHAATPEDSSGKGQFSTKNAATLFKDVFRALSIVIACGLLDDLCIRGQKTRSEAFFSFSLTSRELLFQTATTTFRQRKKNRCSIASTHYQPQVAPNQSQKDYSHCRRSFALDLAVFLFVLSPGITLSAWQYRLNLVNGFAAVRMLWPTARGFPVWTE